MKLNSILIVLAVIAAVGGVAWWRSAPRSADDSDRVEAGATQEQQRLEANETAEDHRLEAGVTTGALCPEPPPVAETTGTASSDSARPASSPAVARALPRVVDLGADKCIPCKKLAPILEELKKEYAGRVTVEFIDVWKDPKAGEPYKIRVIPTQVFFDADGKEVWRHEGFLPKADFVAKFAELGVK